MSARWTKAEKRNEREEFGKRVRTIKHFKTFDNAFA